MDRLPYQFYARVPAKVNLSLAVTGRRGALHTLDMIVCPCEDYADEAVFTPHQAPEPCTRPLSAPRRPVDNSSLWYTPSRASHIIVQPRLRLICESSLPSFDPVRFEAFFDPKLQKIAQYYNVLGDILIKKGVPLGAGLGGSSAATVAAIKAIEAYLDALSSHPTDQGNIAPSYSPAQPVGAGIDDDIIYPRTTSNGVSASDFGAHDESHGEASQTSRHSAAPSCDRSKPTDQGNTGRSLPPALREALRGYTKAAYPPPASDFPRADVDFLLSLGSDVPCMYTGGVCRVQGVGEAVTPLNGERAPHMRVFIPDCSADSAKCYAMYDKMLAGGDISSPSAIPADVQQALAVLRNDLTLPAQTLYPQIADLLRTLRAQHPYVMLSGSGSACVLFYPHLPPL